MKKYSIADMRQLAADHSGKCLSKEYKSMTSKLTWMCARGHTWDTTPSIVKQGGWCAQCLKHNTRRLTIELMHEIADKKDGKCLSKEYKNAWTPLKWECKYGHQWFAKPGHIKNVGSWCPHCAGKARLTIEQMQEAAKKRGGKCLSKIYKSNHVKLMWQCDKGHKWNAAPSKILTGRWCPHYDCRYAKVSEKLRGDIKELRDIAKSRGGKLISKTYINRNLPVTWQCRHGHTWTATASNIKFGLTWCPTCHPRKNDKTKYKLMLRNELKNVR